MGPFRHLIRGRLHAVWALLALSLAMKLVVPPGFMPVFSPSGVAIVVCNGVSPSATTMAMPGMQHGPRDHHGPDKSDSPCAFAGLTAPTLSGADILRVIAILAAIGVGSFLAVAALRVARPDYWRPPLRGPPALA